MLTSAVWTALLAGAALLLTLVTMAFYHVDSINLFALLILSPYALAFVWLGSLFAFHASRRSHRTLMQTTAFLAAATFAAYVPALISGPGGCMSGMIFFSSVAFLAGFPVVFAVCWVFFNFHRSRPAF